MKEACFPPPLHAGATLPALLSRKTEKQIHEIKSPFRNLPHPIRVYPPNSLTDSTRLSGKQFVPL